MRRSRSWKRGSSKKQIGEISRVSSWVPGTPPPLLLREDVVLHHNAQTARAVGESALYRQWIFVSASPDSVHHAVLGRTDNLASFEGIEVPTEQPPNEAGNLASPAMAVWQPVK